MHTICGIGPEREMGRARARAQTGRAKRAGPGPKRATAKRAGPNGPRAKRAEPNWPRAKRAVPNGPGLGGSGDGGEFRPKSEEVGDRGDRGGCAGGPRPKSAEVWLGLG